MPLQPALRVTSRQNPLVTRFRNAARSRIAGDPVVIEGVTLVHEAKRAGWTIEVAAFTDRALGDTSVTALFNSLSTDATRVLVPESVMEALSPARTPSGVVALAGGHMPALDHVLSGEQALVVVTVDVQDPGNLGAIVRAAEAAGATGLLACGASADPFGWKALRGAMGSAFRLPLCRVAEPDVALRTCRDRGLRIIATALEGTSIDDVALHHPCAVFLGAEGTGLPPPLIDAADVRLTIPMCSPVASLNVAVAAGIILYAARRQRAYGRQADAI
jgi:TrmH family RNA methyltransferase